jgi:hypothetical protein
MCVSVQSSISIFQLERCEGSFLALAASSAEDSASNTSSRSHSSNTEPSPSCGTRNHVWMWALSPHGETHQLTHHHHILAPHNVHAHGDVRELSCRKVTLKRIFKHNVRCEAHTVALGSPRSRRLHSQNWS